MNGGAEPTKLNVFYFNIPSIMCSSCVADIKKQLLTQPEVVQVEISEQLKTAKIAVSNLQVTSGNLIEFIRARTIKHHVPELTFKETVEVKPQAQNRPAFQ